MGTNLDGCWRFHRASKHRSTRPLASWRFSLRDDDSNYSSCSQGCGGVVGWMFTGVSCLCGCSCGCSEGILGVASAQVEAGVTYVAEIFSSAPPTQVPLAWCVDKPYRGWDMPQALWRTVWLFLGDIIKAVATRQGSRGVETCCREGSKRAEVPLAPNTSSKMSTYGLRGVV